MIATEIPVFNFSEAALNLEEGSEGWKALCDKVTQACEEYGCFVVAYDGVPMHLYDEFFKALEILFHLPEETKMKNRNNNKFSGYVGKSEEGLHLHQCLGIENATQLDVMKAFTDLMWPQGNPDACRVLSTMTTKMLQLYQLIIKMIFQSLGVSKNYASHVELTSAGLRLLQYDPPLTRERQRALDSHTDETVLTILGDNGVHGLMVRPTKGGDWIPVQLPVGTFAVLVGDSLHAMSNGRLQASEHGVEMAEDKERYSYGLFAGFKGGAVVETFDELVDTEHPPLYRPFDYMDYVRFVNSNYDASANALQVFAGV